VYDRLSRPVDVRGKESECVLRTGYARAMLGMPPVDPPQQGGCTLPLMACPYGTIHGPCVWWVMMPERTKPNCCQAIAVDSSFLAASCGMPISNGSHTQRDGSEAPAKSISSITSAFYDHLQVSDRSLVATQQGGIEISRSQDTTLFIRICAGPLENDSIYFYDPTSWCSAL